MEIVNIWGVNDEIEVNNAYGYVKSTININYPKFSKESLEKKNAESTVTCRNLVYLVISLIVCKHPNFLITNSIDQ